MTFLFEPALAMNEFVSKLIEQMKATSIGECAEFDSVDWKNIEHFFNACIKSHHPDDVYFSEIKEHLAQITRGYGCWLEWVDIGLEDALRKIPIEIKEDQGHLFIGSYQMAKFCLFSMRNEKEQQVN